MTTSVLPPPLTPEQRYRPLSRFLRDKFGAKVYRVTIDGGFTCPNVDGSVAVGGCVYCDNRSFSPNRRLPRTTVRDQVQRGVSLLQKRYRAERFLAYVPAATNTYAPVEKLRRLYDEALEHPQVVGLAIGTRPDCVPDDVLEMLQDYARERYVCLELGLQSIHDRSLDWMNRGHHYDAFLDAVRRCQNRGLDLCIHVILGLPGETLADMLATAEACGALPVQGVKIHNLHVVRDTPLEAMYRLGEGCSSGTNTCKLCAIFSNACRRPWSSTGSGDAPPDYLVARRVVLSTSLHYLRPFGELHRRATAGKGDAGVRGQESGISGSAV